MLKFSADPAPVRRIPLQATQPYAGTSSQFSTGPPNPSADHAALCGDFQPIQHRFAESLCRPPKLMREFPANPVLSEEEKAILRLEACEGVASMVVGQFLGTLALLI